MSEVAIVISNVGMSEFHKYRVEELGSEKNLAILEFIGLADKNITRDGVTLIVLSDILKKDHEEVLSLLSQFAISYSEDCLMIVISSNSLEPFPFVRQDVEIFGSYWDNPFGVRVNQTIAYDA